MPPGVPPSAEARALANRCRNAAALSAVLVAPTLADDLVLATAFTVFVVDFVFVLATVFFTSLVGFFGIAMSSGLVFVSGGGAFTFGATGSTGVGAAGGAVGAAGAAGAATASAFASGGGAV